MSIRWTVLLWALFIAQGVRADPMISAVFVPQEDGFKSIRIPSVVLTKHGVLLAFAEGRQATRDQAQNKILLKRSTDSGKTWGKLSIVAEDGAKSMNNPCAVVESRSGQVFLMIQSYPSGVHERDNIPTGIEGEGIVRNLLLTSADEGVTWSQPRDVTRETKHPEKVTTMAVGPGVGIQLRHGKHAGRLVFPFNEGPYGVWNIYAVYSDDRGKTWKMGETAPGNLVDNPKGGKTSIANEVQCVELKDGTLRFNARRWAGNPVRKTCLSKDGGVTWSLIEDVPELRDPSCMASILRYTDPTKDDKSRILFSGPQSDKRENGVVFLSYDEGATWPVQRVLCAEQFAYSCLTVLPDRSIGCLYEAEGMNRVVFARFTLDWLTEGKDHLARRKETGASSPAGK
ncbi:MAG: nedA 1 [Chthonomonadales bacterium]|nr:nedA 1 [Chthonomonadales bacterium]